MKVNPSQQGGKRLLAWYSRHGRDLPWRHTKDAYAIVVSEMMLQQTQVERVKGFYRDWLGLFPTWSVLARATNAQVIRAWSGLGYNRRALALRDMARMIAVVGEPNTEEKWLAIKGVGPYTAAAIMSFSFGARTVPIDTNVRRVAGRWLLGMYFPGQKSDMRIRRALKKVVDTSFQPAHLIQALFDIASGPCGKVPDCAQCPLRTVCASSSAFLVGKVRIPKKSSKKAKEYIHPGKAYPDRIYRGRIMKSLQQKAWLITDLGPQVDVHFEKSKDAHWLSRLVDRLVKDGLAMRKKDKVHLSDHV